MTMSMPRFGPRCTALLALAAAALSGCAGARNANLRSQSEHDLADLLACMCGIFDSSAQNTRDPDNYFNVRLVMTPIWTAREDAHWLYVEQALVATLDKPYRVRIYRVSAADDGTFHSAVFTLPGDPHHFADGTGRPRPAIEQLSPESLTPREGCTVVLRRDAASSFVGGTVGAGCPSDRSGATYATSVISITPAGIDSWDRGFNAQGGQVWGATMGGYEFRRPTP